MSEPIKVVYNEAGWRVEPYSVKEIRKNIRLDRQALRLRIREFAAAMKSETTSDQLAAAQALAEIADLLRFDLQELHETEQENN